MYRHSFVALKTPSSIIHGFQYVEIENINPWTITLNINGSAFTVSLMMERRLEKFLRNVVLRLAIFRIDSVETNSCNRNNSLWRRARIERKTDIITRIDFASSYWERRRGYVEVFRLSLNYFSEAPSKIQKIERKTIISMRMWVSPFMIHLLSWMNI